MRARLLILSLLFFSTAATAEAPKRGRVLCEGTACAVGIGPEDGGQATDDTSAALTHHEIGNESAPALIAKKTNQKKGNPIEIKKKKEPEKFEAETLFTNLPSFYQGIDPTGIQASEKVVFVPKTSQAHLKNLRPGDLYSAVIEQEITASPSVPTPIRAIVTGGPDRGAIFLGEATLDPELKRVLLRFSKLRLKDPNTVYDLKATGLSPEGSIGLEGEYHSQSGKFFLAELASAAVSGFVDSTIDRSQTALGTYVENPSLSDSAKAATVTALSKTTDRMAENARSAPEFTHIPGFQEIKILIEEDPVLSKT